jgi:hypothetical protein
MAKQLIGVGSSPNDHTGDLVRVAMIKINDNFTEVYDLLGQTATNYIQHSGSTISSTVTNADIVLDPLGTGNVTINADLNVNVLKSTDSSAIQLNDALNVSGAITGGSTLTVDGTQTLTGATTLSTSLAIAGDGAVVTGIKDEDNMASDSNVKLATQQSIKAYVDSMSHLSLIDEDNMGTNSATRPPSQQSVKAYVDAQVTAQDFDFTCDDSSVLSIDLDSEAMQFSGGAGITTAGTGNTVTVAIDSTVVTESSTDTLTNKTLTSPKINEDVVMSATATELNLLDGVAGLVQADLTKLAAVDSTAVELNLMDGGTSPGTNAVASGDGIVTNDGGTMRQTTLDTFDTYLSASTKTLTNKTLTTPVIASLQQASGSNTLTMPAATDTLVGKATTDTLTNKTLTSPVFNTAVSGTAILDEDNMATNSATQLSTQQSIKAYVDSQSPGAWTVFGDDSAGVNISNGGALYLQGGSSITTTSNSDGTLTIALNDSIDINSISSTDSSAVMVNDNLTIAGTLGTAGSDILHITDGVSIEGHLTVSGDFQCLGASDRAYITEVAHPTSGGNPVHLGFDAANKQIFSSTPWNDDSMGQSQLRWGNNSNGQAYLLTFNETGGQSSFQEFKVTLTGSDSIINATNLISPGKLSLGSDSSSADIEITAGSSGNILLKNHTSAVITIDSTGATIPNPFSLQVGSLNIQQNEITSDSNADIEITPSGTGSVVMATAKIIMANLPTSDPGVAGQLWRSTNDLKISTG